MSRTLQFKRYSNTALLSVTGAVGELIVDTTNDTITVHDGTTAGGTRLATERFVGINPFSQAAFNQANTAGTTANSALTLANYGIGVNIAQNTNIGLAWSQANSAFTAANNAAQTIPQNAQSENYVLQSSDAGKHLYYTNSSAVNLYIPWTANTSWANGTSITIISQTGSSANITVLPNTGVSLFLAGNTTSNSRIVTTYGMASLIMVKANTWFINGTGVV